MRAILLISVALFLLGCKNTTCPGMQHNLIDTIELRVSPSYMMNSKPLLDAANNWNVLFKFNIVEVKFTNDNPNVTFTTFENKIGNTYTEMFANMLVNYSIQIDLNKNTNYEHVYMHEIGHILGFGHTNKTVMNPEASGNMSLNSEQLLAIECIKENVNGI